MFHCRPSIVVSWCGPVPPSGPDPGPTPVRQPKVQHAGPDMPKIFNFFESAKKIKFFQIKINSFFERLSDGLKTLKCEFFVKKTSNLLQNRWNNIIWHHVCPVPPVRSARTDPWSASVRSVRHPFSVRTNRCGVFENDGNFLLFHDNFGKIFQKFLTGKFFLSFYYAKYYFIRCFLIIPLWCYWFWWCNLWFRAGAAVFFWN